MLFRSALFFLPAFAQPFQAILPKVGTFVNLNAGDGDKGIAVVVGYHGLKVIGAYAYPQTDHSDARASGEMPAYMVSMDEIHRDSHLKGYILHLDGKIIDVIKAKKNDDITPMSIPEVSALKAKMMRE